MTTEFSLQFKNKYRTLLATVFSLEELNLLSTSLGIDFEEISGNTKTTKVLELIQYVQRRGWMDRLVQESINFHTGSNIDWLSLGDEIKTFLEKKSDKRSQLEDIPSPEDIENLGAIKNRFALLIGINAFDNARYNSLQFCENDADLMHSRLQQLGFSVTKMKGTDIGTNLYPTRVNILAQLKRICNNAEREDLILLYFATHGVRHGERQTPYLVAKDTQSEQDLFEDTAVSVDRLITMLKKSKCKRHLLLLDACHMGVDRGTDDEQEEFHRYVYDRAQGIALLAASAADQTAIENNGNGLFTRFLVEGLGGAADKAKKGFITVSDISNYVLYRVRAWYDERHQHRQDPTYRNEGIGDMIVAQIETRTILKKA